MHKEKIKEVNCQDCIKFNNSVFETLNGEGLNMLNSFKRCKTIKTDHHVFHEGDYIHDLYCIIKGKVKISKINVHGKEQIFRLAKEGGLLGFRSLFSSENHTCTATTLEDTTLCVIPKD